MAKRFIDTGLYDDEWFMELSKDGKLFWIYAMTKCDHAGILKLNRRLCKTQTGIQDIDKVLKELGNRLVTLHEPYLFIPKFLFYQYPNFPHSNAKAQKSAIEILSKFELLDKGSLTLKEGLGNYYGNGNGNGKSGGKSQSLTHLNDQELGDYKEIWLDYLQHRKELGVKPYKSHSSEMHQFKQLLSLSQKSIRTAKGIVAQSRGNQWKGLFELKDESYLPQAEAKQRPMPKIKDI